MKILLFLSIVLIGLCFVIETLSKSVTPEEHVALIPGSPNEHKHTADCRRGRRHGGNGGNGGYPNTTPRNRSTVPIFSTTPAPMTQEIHRWVKPTLVQLQMRKRNMPKKPPNPRSSYIEWNHDAELFAFGKRLKEEFDCDLLKTAFTHREYIIQEEMRQREVGIENPDLQLKDNADLIEEGEALMFSYIRSYLDVALPKFPEPGIVAIRDYLMTNANLANISKHLGTKDIILSSEYPPGEIILSNTFKAIIGALIHSSGSEKASHFVRDFVITNLNGVDVNEIWVIENPMEYLTELLKKSNKVPELRLIGQIGKNSLLACYQVGIYTDKEMFCSGFGESIAIASEMAAREGLKLLFGTSENMAPIDFKISGTLRESLQKNRVAAP